MKSQVFKANFMQFSYELLIPSKVVEKWAAECEKMSLQLPAGWADKSSQKEALSGATCKYFASLRGINHIKRDFLCRHTVRMIITTIINIIMCPTLPRPPVCSAYFCCCCRCCCSTLPSSLQLFTKSEHVRAVLLCANMRVRVFVWVCVTH